MTTKRSTAHAAAYAAVGPFLAAVADRLRTAAGEGRTDVDIDDLTDDITAVFDAHRPGSAGDGVAAVRTLLANYTRSAESARDRGLLSEQSGTVAASQLGIALAAFDAALADFGQQEDLDTARRHVADLVGQREARQAELEAAVLEGDLDAVMSLRPIVEIDLPDQIGKAQQTVLDLQAAQAEATLAIPARRRTEARAAAAAATTAIQVAQAVLEAALAAGRDAALTAMLADNAASVVETQHARAVAARDQHPARHAAEQMRRLRAFAGLPEPLQPTVTATAADETKQVDPVSTLHGGTLDTPTASRDGDDEIEIDAITRSGAYSGIDWDNLTGADDDDLSSAEVIDA